jgi:hypothetical protein
MERALKLAPSMNEKDYLDLLKELLSRRINRSATAPYLMIEAISHFRLLAPNSRL